MKEENVKICEAKIYINFKPVVTLSDTTEIWKPLRFIEEDFIFALQDCTISTVLYILVTRN